MSHEELLAVDARIETARQAIVMEIFSGIARVAKTPAEEGLILALIASRLVESLVMEKRGVLWRENLLEAARGERPL